MLTTARRTIDGTANPSVVKAGTKRNNGRYNGNGRHWATPWDLYRKLDAEFQFTLDPCATEQSAKCDLYYTEVENGLAQDWSGERVFMNPPYGAEIYAWAEKAHLEADSGSLVVGLLPHSSDLAWWHDHVVNVAETRSIRGRVRFLTDRHIRASGFFPSVVVIWWPLDQRAGKLLAQAFQY